jgi:alpha-glucosidase (family GH31 glycosyl hydrolase)
MSPVSLTGIQAEGIDSIGEIKSSELKDYLKIETYRFLCIINKEPFSFHFINKSSLDTFKITSSDIGNPTSCRAKFNVKGVKSLNHWKNCWGITTSEPDLQLKIEVIKSEILKLTVELSDNKKTIHLISEGHGPFYGGGERFLSTRLNGRSFTNQPNDRLFPKHFEETALREYEPTYIPIPFILNPYGFGLYVDNAETTKIKIDDKGGSIEINVNNNITNLYLFASGSPKDVLTSYTSVVGRQPSIPEWGLGVWINLLEGRDSVIAKAERLKKWDMPVNAVWVFDIDDPSTSTGWTHWSKGYYGKPRNLTDALHKMDLKVLTYLHPYEVKKLLYYKFDNPVYKYCLKNNMLLNVDSIVDNKRFATMNPHEQLDFYNSATHKWWSHALNEILADDNFDGWMEDFGDIGYKYDFESNEWSVLNYKTNYPFSNEVLANLYPLVYHKTTFSIAKSVKPDMISFCRSGSAGSAPYAALIWGGDQTADWDKKTGYPCLITAGMSSGLSGYGIWAPDILCNSPSVELWKRWVQLGAFSPTMRDHLWENNPKSIDIWTNSYTKNYFKAYAMMHLALEPYLSSLAKEASGKGIPMIRHMMLEYPNDSVTYGCEYQYMLGSELIIAPVVEKSANTKTVYLPAGEWIYFWTNIEYKGEKWVEVEAPANWIPFFIRKNSSIESIGYFIMKAREFNREQSLLRTEKE